MKRMTYFVMALALVLGFTQCKKEQVNTPGNETKTVNITLNVGGNGGGSRHDINTTTGAVDFQDDDVIYVGDSSTYIGTLTRTDGVFSGPINEPANGTEIYFYFVGGLTTTPADLSGQSSFTVDISDQSTKMPVLSCNHVTYYSNTTSYSCKLENQCALVKFTTASGTDDPVHVGGLYTEAQIDFASKTIAHTDTKGFVNLYPDAVDNTAKWAVLLPQTGFEGAEAAIAHVGYTTTIPTIEADAFITGNDAVSISTQSNIVYLDWLTSNYTATDGQTLKGTLAGNYQISIADGATVILNNATISYTGNNNDWAGLTLIGDGTLVLADGSTNTVRGGLDEDGYSNWPGIYVPVGKTLTINGNTGVLNASRGNVANDNGSPAGIGARWGASCGNIVINGGVINATGGFKGAGIGGCGRNGCGDITINGGTVNATGGHYAAGIGLGGTDNSSNTDCGTCGNITINGGTVTANGGHGGAGIGTGYAYNAKNMMVTKTCGDITIRGGTVTANGGESAAGIGTGKADAYGNLTVGDITINNSVTLVTATHGSNASYSIGRGSNTSSGSITCGTITIGGTEYPSGATPNQSDGLTFVYPVPAPPTAPAGAINGLFSVSATQQVWFSQGNLLNTGNFADNQYDYGGLLQWAAPFTSNYSGEWRALTSEEWNYLLTDRANASKLWGFANVGYSNGIILLPDGSSLSINTDHSAWSNNTIDETTWLEMEANGAVFLPAAGYLDGGTPEDNGKKGYYWCSTSGEYVRFGGSGSSFEAPTYYVGGGGRRSVRLVINVQ